ncbi:MAG: hypothetical protein ACKVVP_16980, partial [Chloroflexota bacterium]
VESGVTANTQARDMALQLGDAVELAIRESNLAIDQFLAGQFTVAREGLERAVGLCRGVAAEYRAVNSLLWLGRVGLAEGDLKRAKRDAELALDLAREAGARFIPDCHDVIGAVRIAESNWDAAESSFRQALSMRNRTDHLAGCICSLIGLGEVHEHRGVWAEARSCYAEAVGIGQQMDPSPHLVGAKRHLGMLLHMLSERENARAELEAAMTLASSMASSVEYPPMLLAAATVNWQELQLQERIDIAQKALERGLTASLAIEGHALIAQLQCTLANQTEAAKHADASVTCAESFGVAHLCAIAWSTRAGVTAAAGFAPATAVTELQRALGWIQQADSALGRERALNFARQCVAQIPEIPDEIKRALDYSLHPSLTPN